MGEMLCRENAILEKVVQNQRILLDICRFQWGVHCLGTILMSHDKAAIGNAHTHPREHDPLAQPWRMGAKDLSGGRAQIDQYRKQAESVNGGAILGHGSDGIVLSRAA